MLVLILKGSFFKITGEPLSYTVEEVIPGEQYKIRVFLDKPVKRGERLEIIAKAHTGGRIWLEAPHHRRLIVKGKPTELISRRSVDKPRYFHATLRRMPRGTILLDVYPQPWRIYAENDRLNILFVFYTQGIHVIYLKYIIP